MTAGPLLARPYRGALPGRPGFLPGRGVGMTSTEDVSLEQSVDKGLKSGALGLISTTIIATASVAPAYSIAATLVFVVGFVGLQSPAVAVLAFVPMLFCSIG